ncbi:hypothetical protein XI03_38465 [Bradyrhizobium sp. CCBAU 65884]|nr:hypothetical protein [Bradyrhizobium sp. CCBAU 65884]
MNRDLDLADFELHPQRGAVLAEVHARPFTRLTAPVTVLRFAFLGQGEVATADRQSFVAFCMSHGQAPPDAGTKHHQVTIGDTQLRWEQHSEFSTFTWILSSPQTPARRFGEIGEEPAALIRSLRQSGQLLVRRQARGRADFGGAGACAAAVRERQSRHRRGPQRSRRRCIRLSHR